MKKLLLALLLLWPSLAFGQGTGGTQVICNKTAQGSSGAATTLIVPAVTPNAPPAPGQVIAVCGFDITTGAAAATYQLVYGTGATCGTGTVNWTAAHNLGATSGISSTGRNISTPSSNPAQGLCIIVTGTGPVQWTVYYAQF